MSYIFIDLEYNQAKEAGFNEIIEIGAVKLNDFLEIESEFNSFVYNDLSPYVVRRILKMMKVDYKKIKHAPYFWKAITKFEEWMGNDYQAIFTWGNDDMYVLRDNYLNQKLYKTYSWIFEIIDLQEKYSKIYKRIFKKDQVSLKQALEYYKISQHKQHRALEDARNTAKIFQIMNNRLKYTTLLEIYRSS